MTFFLGDEFLTGDCLNLHTDSSGSVGYGAVGLYDTAWFHGKWPSSWKSLNISALELFPIVAAIEVWGMLWPTGEQSCVFLHRQRGVGSIINSSTSREPHIMALLRRLVLACLRFNINCMSRHVPGRYNVLADVSRGQVEEFRKLAPWADVLPTELPRDVE